MIGTVQIDQEVMIPTDGANTDITISSTGGTQFITIHTSCSKELFIGDRFGGLVSKVKKLCTCMINKNGLTFVDSCGVR